MKTKLMLGAVILALFLPSITSSTPLLVPEVNVTHPGTWLWVDGSGFPAKVDFEMFLDNTSVANGTTYLGGQLSRKVTIPRTISLGTHDLTVVAGGATATAEITIIQWPVQFSATPTEIHPGEEIEVCGTGYPPNAYYEVYLDSTEILAGATDGDGNFCGEYILPKTAGIGLQRFSANATRYTGPPSSSELVNVIQWSPALTLDPQAPSPGMVIEIDGDSLPPTCLYRILLDGNEILRGGCNAQGEFSNTYLLPPVIQPGHHTVSVEAFEYTGPPRATGNLDVVQWNSSLSTTPGSLHPGMNATFQGSGFPPNTRVILSLDDSVIFSGNTTPGGEFSYQQPLAPDLDLGYYEAVAVAPDYAGPPTFTLEVLVEQWPLNLSIAPTSVHPGSELQISGNGFPPSTGYDLFLDSTKITAGTTNSTGFISGQYKLSNWISLGSHSIRCTVRDHTGPPEVVLDLLVTNWPMHTDVSPESPRPGEEVDLTGSEYPPGSAYYVYIDDSPICEGIVGGNQGFSSSIDLPRNLSVGEHLLSVSSSFPNLDPVNITLEVIQWSVGLSADTYSGSSGDLVQLEGSGFPPGAPVQIFYDGIYVKAAETTVTGGFTTVLLIPEDGENVYHKIRADASGGYAGPPSVYLYYWVGDFPPTMDFTVCDSDGNPASRFFVGDDIHMRGNGFPVSVEMTVHLVDPAGVSIEAAVSSVSVSTDYLGFLQLSPVGSSEDMGTLLPWLDANNNGVNDANDLLGETLDVQYRPDISVDGASISDVSLTEGQVIAVEIEVSNQGMLPAGGTIVLAYRDVQVASATFDPIDPGTSVKFNVSWDTSSSPVGQGTLVARATPLPGEINLQGNELDVGPVSISPGPDVFVNWVNPSDRTVHKGEKIIIPVRLTNRGQQTYASLLSIAWGEEEVVSRSISIPGGSSLTFRLEWDTTSATVGTRTLSASIGVLEYEKDPSDNLLVNGTVQVTPPNRPPDTDPGGPYSGYPGEALDFDGRLSFDIDGQIVSYRWDFGDGSWSYGDIVTHAYDDEGDYSVTLTAVDDDGDSSSADTMAHIRSGQMITMRVLVHDGIKGTPVSGARLEVGSSIYYTGEEAVIIEVEKGQQHVGISKPGYVGIEEDIQVEGDKDLNFTIEPLIQLSGSDAGGGLRTYFTEVESIYVSIWAPGEYPAQLYVLPDGGAEEGQVLLDLTHDGHERILTDNGTVIEIVWREHAVKGSYDVVLDLNSNGLYESTTDRLFNEIGPAFRVPEALLQLIILSGIAAGMARARH